MLCNTSLGEFTCLLRRVDFIEIVIGLCIIGLSLCVLVILFNIKVLGFACWCWVASVIIIVL